MPEVQEGVADNLQEPSLSTFNRRRFFEISAIVALSSHSLLMAKEIAEKDNVTMCAELTEILRTNDYLFMDWGSNTDYREEQRNRVKALIMKTLHLPEHTKILLTVDHSPTENTLQILVHDAQSPFNVEASFSKLRLGKKDGEETVKNLILKPTLADLTERQLNQRLRAHFNIGEKLKHRATVSSTSKTEDEKITATLRDKDSMMIIGELVCDEEGHTIFDSRLNEGTMLMLTAEKAAE